MGPDIAIAPARAPRWRARLQNGWQTWLQRRHPRQDRITLNQRHVYILPSRPGWAFAATLTLILLAAINEQLSLGYLLCFALLGVGLVAMHSTQGNLRGLTLTLLPPAGGHAAHAGDALGVEITLQNPGAMRHAISLQWMGAPGQDEPTWTDVPAQGQVRLQLRWTPPARGLHPLPALRISSSFPLGLLRSWSLWRPAATVCAYPRAEPAAPPWPSSRQEHQAGPPMPPATSTPGVEDFRELRAYRHGDRPRQVLWKKAAQRSHPQAPLLVRDGHGALAEECRFDLQQTQGLPLEAALSRLCSWVLAAERDGRPYQLMLPDSDSGLGQGAEHARLCLRQLALHGQDERTEAAKYPAIHPVNHPGKPAR